MEALQNKKLYPLYFLIALALMPATFLFCLHKFFEINDFETLINFAWLIVQNVGEKPLKPLVYLAFAMSFSPPLFMFYLLKDKKQRDSHGKARWANSHDIQKTTFSLIKLLKDALELINPLNFTPKRYSKAFSKFLDFGLTTTTPMLETNFTRGGFLLGIYKDLWRKRKVYYDAPLSALIVAPPGAGKSAAVALPNLLTLPTSCVVLDIKGELCNMTAGYRQKVLKNEIYVFNPLGKDNNLQFNPFDKKIVSKMNFNEKKRLVDEIANTIFVDEQGQDPHWMSKAKELFTFYALYDLCTKNQSDFFSIANAPIKDYKPLIQKDSPFYERLWEIDEKTGKKTLIEDADPQKLFYEQCADQKYLDIANPLNWVEESFEQIQENRAKGMETLDEVVRNYARAWSMSAENEFASIKSTFNRIMSVFTSYQVRDATSSMSFEYEDLRRRNITLYIKIAQTDIDTLKSLIRVLLESIAKNLMTRESKKPSERIYLVLDEFIRFGKMPFLLEMPALCRSYGVVPLYITQSYGLIKKYYGEDDLKSMTDTIAFQILFKMNDADSAENVSKQIGKYTRENRSYSTKDGSMIFGGTSSFSLEGTELITAQDILNIPNDEIIILVSGFKAKPIKLKACYYYKEKEFLSRCNLPYDPTNKALLPQKTTIDVVAQAPQDKVESQAQESTNTQESANAVIAPTPTTETTPQENQADLRAQAEADDAKALYLLEESQKLEESLKDKTQEQIQQEIDKLYSVDRKEYVYQVTDKMIDAKLKAPLSVTAPIPNSTFVNIQKETKPLKDMGFVCKFSDMQDSETSFKDV